ncbi:MAG: family 43 glycosylhydrolase [Lachnospiraceae bacterium]|nr:family 43 glycosylhydrolase [Lachnospiraceae bacterium]
MDEVELLVNGKSYGRKTMEKNWYLGWDEVVYEPGTLTAQGYRNGELVLTESVETTGAPYQIVLEPYQDAVGADDTAIVQVSVRDEAGRIVPNADNEIRFNVSGAGSFLGTGNGNPGSHESDLLPVRRVFNGLGQLLVRSSRQETDGVITVTAVSPGLHGASVSVGVKAACAGFLLSPMKKNRLPDLIERDFNKKIFQEKKTLRKGDFIMPNPYLPTWEYIPDGESRVFGDRVYVYGSHDKAGSDSFCDYVLKCWSAPLTNLNQWTCHGDIFHTRADRDHRSDTDWTGENNQLYAPDVVEKDGKYYLYAYIIGAKGCVAVSDRPEGPFTLLSNYQYTISDEICCNGWFIDPGVLVDDDGRVFIYCGYERSFMAEINGDNMYEVLDGTCIEHIIPCEITEDGGFDAKEKIFFEAASLRKVKDTYYLIYSPKRGSRLAYATSDKPTGPFTYRGYLVDNGVDYPGGNNHGSIACINGQWYIFYHRMTNNSIMSRRACVERIEMREDGTILPVEMTSLGFEESLNPYQTTPADIACVLKGSAFITERNPFERVVTNITDKTVIGYKYFDFGEDFSSQTMEFAAQINGFGADCTLHIRLDGEDGEEIGSCRIGHDGGVVQTVVTNVTGRHAVFFTVSTDYSGWTAEFFKGRQLFELKAFVFMK